MYINMRTELERYEQRQAHPANCPCDDCVLYDIERFELAHPLSNLYKRNRTLEERNDPELNWSFPRGHCILCGGVDANASSQADHFAFYRYNEVYDEKRGLFYTSIRETRGPDFLPDFDFVARTGMFHPLNCKEHEIRPRLFDWAGAVLEINPEYITGYATRVNDKWKEIRFALTQIVEETYDERLERVTGRRKETPRNAAYTGVHLCAVQ